MATNASLFSFCSSQLSAQTLTLVELNCENLFDCRHDTLKQDTEWLPQSARHWTPSRYWQKLNRIAQTIIASSADTVTWQLPDLVVLCEVENDSVLTALTRRSLLRGARYDYLMTTSPDVRGIDVALLYQPFAFRPVCYDELVVKPLPSMRPTRNILYVQGEVLSGDTIHLFVVHAPSRYGGERATRAHRLLVAERLLEAVGAIRARQPGANIVVAGDFNDVNGAPALELLARHQLADATAAATGRYRQATGSYRWRGRWQHLDHVLLSPSMQRRLAGACVNDAPFLTEPDSRYGGRRPRRTYIGFRHQAGYSDHLPLIVTFHW